MTQAVTPVTSQVKDHFLLQAKLLMGAMSHLPQGKTDTNIHNTEALNSTENYFPAHFRATGTIQLKAINALLTAD